MVISTTGALGLVAPSTGSQGKRQPSCCQKSTFTFLHYSFGFEVVPKGKFVFE